MSKSKFKRRTKIKPFVKYINYTHMMPTRYIVDIDLKKILDEDVMAKPESRVETRKLIKKVFEERYEQEIATINIYCHGLPNTSCRVDISTRPTANPKRKLLE